MTKYSADLTPPVAKIRNVAKILGLFGLWRIWTHFFNVYKTYRGYKWTKTWTKQQFILGLFGPTSSLLIARDFKNITKNNNSTPQIPPIPQGRTRID
tara:strand:- start:1740 stop:2030 length:291 start_codon:yes stop_codon:yes gene_type:complete